MEQERDLFVDDIRILKNGRLRINIPTDIARNYDEAVYLIEIYDYDFVSLDYSMDGKTGLDVLKFMKECNKNPSRINIHSDHSTGVSLMKEYAENNFTEATITFNAI